jgi:hypothetical protein
MGTLPTHFKVLMMNCQAITSLVALVQQLGDFQSFLTETSTIVSFTKVGEPHRFTRPFKMSLHTNETPSTSLCKFAAYLSSHLLLFESHKHGRICPYGRKPSFQSLSLHKTGRFLKSWHIKINPMVINLYANSLQLFTAGSQNEKVKVPNSSI